MTLVALLPHMPKAYGAMPIASRLEFEYPRQPPIVSISMNLQVSCTESTSNGHE